MVVVVVKYAFRHIKAGTNVSCARAKPEAASRRFIAPPGLQYPAPLVQGQQINHRRPLTRIWSTAGGRTQHNACQDEIIDWEILKDQFSESFKGGGEAESLAKQRANRLRSLPLSHICASDQNATSHIAGNDSPPVLTFIRQKTVARHGAFPGVQGVKMIRHMWGYDFENQ